MKFSLVITCYNQRDFIGAAVDSALSQQHRPGEIIVVDDGSTDGSLEMVQRFGASIKLVRFSRNIGAIEARNEGAARAEGEYVVFLDGDDLFVPWAFDVYHTIVEQRDPKIVVSARQWFQGASPLLTKSGLPSSVEFIEYTNLLAKDRGATGGLGASGLIVHRQALQNVGGWSRGIFHLDVIDFTLKLGYSGRTVLVCSPRTVLYRFHTANSILTVPPFLRMAHRIMEREKAGEYPGGKEHRFERYAYLGGVIAFWASNAMRARFYVDALRLAVLGSPMILAAIVHKLSARASHRHAVVTVNLPLDSNKTGSTIDDCISSRGLPTLHKDDKGIDYATMGEIVRRPFKTLAEWMVVHKNNKMFIAMLVAVGCGLVWLGLHASHHWHAFHNITHNHL